MQDKNKILCLIFLQKRLFFYQRAVCNAMKPLGGATIKHYLTPAGLSARRQAQNKSPGIRSDIAQPGGFCRGVREGSVLAYSTRAATTARGAPAINRRQAALSIKTTLRLLRVERNDWRNSGCPELGAISHGRACFAEESAMGAYLCT